MPSGPWDMAGVGLGSRTVAVILPAPQCWRDAGCEVSNPVHFAVSGRSKPGLQSWLQDRRPLVRSLFFHHNTVHTKALSACSVLSSWSCSVPSLTAELNRRGEGMLPVREQQVLPRQELGVTFGDTDTTEKPKRCTAQEIALQQTPGSCGWPSSDSQEWRSSRERSKGELWNVLLCITPMSLQDC